MDLRNLVWGNFLANWLMCWLMREHKGMLERKRWEVTSSSLVVSFQTLLKMLVELGAPTLVCRGAAPPRFLPRPCWPPWCNPALRFLQQFQTHSSSGLPSTLQDASVCTEATNIPHQVTEQRRSCNQTLQWGDQRFSLFLIRTFANGSETRTVFHTASIFVTLYVIPTYLGPVWWLRHLKTRWL